MRNRRGKEKWCEIVVGSPGPQWEACLNKIWNSTLNVSKGRLRDSDWSLLCRDLLQAVDCVCCPESEPENPPALWWARAAAGRAENPGLLQAWLGDLSLKPLPSCCSLFRWEQGDRLRASGCFPEKTFSEGNPADQMLILRCLPALVLTWLPIPATWL